jgi:hypothetical protein
MDTFTHQVIADARHALQTEVPAHALRHIARLRADLDRIERGAVEVMRAEGASWTEIAAALGTSRQNAQQRFGPKGSSNTRDMTYTARDGWTIVE